MDVLKVSAAEDTVALVNRILAGDPNAETELVERYGRGLRAVIRHNGGHSAVDDLSQETFRIVLEKIRAGEVRQPEKLRKFICGVGRNLARRAAKKSRLRNETGLEEADVVADSAPGPYERLLRKEEIEFVRRLIGELPQARDREVLRRFYCDKDDREQICAELGLTVPQFNQVLSRAQRRFREWYKKHGRKF